ncbi:periplasmic binding protein [Thermanaerovibrio acidaminovorans DSM 6589]|uniref:Periplasmic binding protein n=1 Tax=Thermanaerovibrio acidaminovorans (strain ATCC 49978 / DSM 6589 / Su883) TaxID=525903 RepID=D1B7P0_THEAS|nr:ABC transporter substrate-binding protein [Thermanaerovibrio acidaminovorans]ACZ18293.1 periplasmic binding protein [Thermanaerovibrio acidaminovorans DSM 6589]
MHKRRLVILLAVLLLAALPRFSWAVTVMDDLGRRVTVKGQVRRIVSLYPAHTENLVALGVRDRIVGISQGDDPDLVKGARQLPLRPSPETILSLKPDLVVMRSLQSSMQPQLISQLEGFVPVAVLDPPSFDGLESYVLRLGTLVGRRKEAQAKLKWALGILEESRRRNRGRSLGAVLIVNNRDATTCSPGTWPSRLMEASGLPPAVQGVPTSEGSAVARLGAEGLLAASPKIKVILVQRGPMNPGGLEDFLRDQRFAPMEAVRRGSVFQVDERDVSRPSLMRLQRGLNLLSSIREGAK